MMRGEWADIRIYISIYNDYILNRGAVHFFHAVNTQFTLMYGNQLGS